MNKKIVAIYGELREGLKYHKMYLKNSESLGTFWSAPDYNLYELNDYPVLLENGHTSICMEAYNVTSDVLDDVDCIQGVYEDEPKFGFYRKEIINTPFGEGIVYIYNVQDPEEFKDANVVNHGDWKDYYNTKKNHPGNNESLLLTC